MPYTYCPNCVAKTEWAPKCSRCGAVIPLFDTDAKKDAGVSQTRTDAAAKHNVRQGESDSPILPAIIGLCIVAVIVAIIVAIR